MEQVNELIRYLTSNPKAAIAAAVAVAALVYFFTRKPKMVRDADSRLRQLRDEKGDQYNRPRPLR
jgi:hypothetical protein